MLFLIAFLSLFKRPSSQSNNDTTAILIKRKKGGDDKTSIAICLQCFQDKKKKFWLSRYNLSTVRSHLEKTHKCYCEDVSQNGTVVNGDAICAREAMKEYNKIHSTITTSM